VCVCVCVCVAWPSVSLTVPDAFILPRRDLRMCACAHGVGLISLRHHNARTRDASDGSGEDARRSCVHALGLSSTSE
jgi:hypothetical protein